MRVPGMFYQNEGGGSGPGDHPGYQFMQVTGNADTDTANLQTLEAQGYRFLVVISATEILLQRGY